jgi:tripartite-type tricarboxylate transporter receptor subunit TctC
VPTVAASGLPGYESVSLLGMLAPAGTPPAIINRLNHEIVQVLRRPVTKERLFDLGLETVDSTPEQFAATMKSEIAKWTRVIKSANIHIQ